MIRFVLSLLLTFPILCQTLSVDYSPQGPVVLQDLTGKVIPGMQVVTALVCTDTPLLQSNGTGFGGGKIYTSATDAGFTWTSDLSVQPVLDAIVQKNWKTITLQLLTRGALLAAEITSGGIIKVTSSVTTGLIIGHDVSDQTIGFLKDHAINSAPLTQNLWQSNNTYDITTCRQGYMMARWTKTAPMNAKRVTIPARGIPTPLAVPLTVPPKTAEIDPDYVPHPAGWWQRGHEGPDGQDQQPRYPS